MFLDWVTDLARTHTRELAAVAVRERLSRDDALDAVQDAFHTLLGLAQARSLAGDRDDAVRLMAVLVRNSARNLRRRHHRARPHVELDTDRLAGDLPTVDDLIDQVERHLALVGCVNKLALVQRQVVTLRMLEELAPAEAAAELGLTPSYLAVVLHRAKLELRDCMS